MHTRIVNMMLAHERHVHNTAHLPVLACSLKFTITMENERFVYTCPDIQLIL